MADDKSKGLDRSQPHAQIFGDDEGRVWEQGGRFFTADGSPWKPRKEATSGVRAAEEKAAEVVRAIEKKAEGVVDQLAQQLKG